jgi:NADPH:quinone reductase-like Zn-dependent oxidoreductase
VVQLATDAGAKVIGLASAGNHGWLREHVVTPLAYGEGIAARVRQFGSKVDAFIDTFGHGYVDLAIELGFSPERINTVIDFASAQKHPGAKTAGSHEAANAGVLAELLELMATGRLGIPIARVYPLASVREAYRELELRHTRGKIVLVPWRDGSSMLTDGTCDRQRARHIPRRACGDYVPVAGRRGEGLGVVPHF